jgi:arsenate reductase (glutaredoxin)
MADQSPAITIYHNPACGTSRNTLALIRNAGIEPTIIEYLKVPPDQATRRSPLALMGIRPRALLREKGTPYAELDLGATHWNDEQLIEQMLAHPILINRPSTCCGRPASTFRSAGAESSPALHVV